MAELEFNKELNVQTTPIPGLLVVDIPVFGDNRGWFKENWQRAKMTSLGLPDFGPVQHSMSFNVKKGTTRGVHAEPWDKFISIGNGKIFGAWVDLREGETFGTVFSTEIDPSKGVFVPRGVGNSFQTLEDDVVYTYLVNDHWSAEAKYTFVNLADPTINIPWPIPLSEAEISEKDRAHPHLADVVPMKPKATLIVGANGQLGQALQRLFPDAECVGRDELDISSNDIFTARHWKDYSLILNAAAYTAVDQAETEGRTNAWQANAVAVANLAMIASENQITLVHVSSDYVFDGSKDNHTEDELFSPVSVYGQSKAAGDIVASTTPKHYIVRSSWVVGKGKNFILTMKSLAERGIKPSVVNDQIGRLTFTDDLAKGIKHLLDTKAPYGAYNLTNDGDSVSWANIAKLVYERAGKSADDVTPVSTEEYYKDKEGIAPRPLQSTLSLDKIKATGFTPRDWRQALDDYLQNQ